jgi:hypothetical protein
MAQTPPYITCRATTIKCGHRANNYILLICTHGHISEIALCEAHTSYNNIHHPQCPDCRFAVEDAMIVNIADVTNTHLAEYVFHTRNEPRGATILPDDGCEDLPKCYLTHIFTELGGFTQTCRSKHIDRSVW